MEKSKSGDHITSVLDSIKNHDDSTALRRHIDRCTPKVLQLWMDRNNYDLLHHAILQNNVVAAGTFFSRGLFKSPHTPAFHPYLHLASYLGHRSLVIMLMQERMDDNKPEVFQFVDVARAEPSASCSRLQETDNCDGGDGSPKKGTPLDVARAKPSASGPRLQEIDGDNDDGGDGSPKKRTPLDIAANAGHLPCVKAILDLCQIESKPCKTAESYTDVACRLDSPSALRLLLTEEPSKDDLQKAVALALKMAKPECLDTLLRYRINPKTVFGGMNFFHVLFTYSYSFDESWYESLVVVTSILLRHGHAVLAFRPSRTYALYSLLAHTHFHDLERSAPYRIACLLLLLNSGADPNFDEVKIEELIHENEYETAFGRSAYPSALHCFYDTTSTYVIGDCDQDCLAKYMFKCTELLLNHGADVNYIGQIGEGFGTSLHALAQTCAQVGVPRQTLSLLLRHGADADLKTDCLPLETFCKVLSEGLASRPTSEEAITQEPFDCKRLAPIIKGMSLVSLYETERFIRTAFDENSSSNRNTCLGVLLAEVQSYTYHVWSLKRICSHVVWTRSHRNFRHIAQLPLPVGLKTEILTGCM